MEGERFQIKTGTLSIFIQRVNDFDSELFTGFEQIEILVTGNFMFSRTNITLLFLLSQKQHTYNVYIQHTKEFPPAIDDIWY